MSSPRLTSPKIQTLPLLLGLGLSVILLGSLFGEATSRGLLFLIALGLGISLYHAAFGFTAAYRRALTEKDITGVTAQLLMLGLALLLFAPFLESREIFGQAAYGFVQPVSLGMAVGAFVFGIGMQLGGGCASGTLFTAGGGNLRMLLVFVFFCAGSFWGSLDLEWWRSLGPSYRFSFVHSLGWEAAVGLQGLMLFAVFGLLYALGARIKQPLWVKGGLSWRSLLQGPWPIVLAALLLAVLNWATLAVSGGPWGITSGFMIWGAKVAYALGWDPSLNSYWDGRVAVLESGWISGKVTLMNLGLMVGALLAAALAGKVRPDPRIPWRSLLAAILGGLLMGYGARLAYGCNIGAFFSGIASSSLHGWIWILCALPGNIIGVRLRPYFGLGN